MMYRFIASRDFRCGRILLLNFFFCSMLFIAQAQSKAKQEIMKVLEAQEQAWNNGDLESFMQGYWKSDSLLFIGSRGITRGWQQTFDNYKRSYPDKKSMGKLTFEIVKIESDRKSAFLIGKWNLQREEKENVGGHFTLFFRKIKKEWKIVADHTS